MKKVKVKCRRFFEVEYEMNVEDQDYERLIYGENDPDVEVDLTTEAFNRFDEDLTNWSLNRFSTGMDYESDYQIETEDGGVVVSFDDGV